MRRAGCLAMLAAIIGAAVSLAGTGHAAAEPGAQPPQARVVVIAVPDLRWSDLASMPHLAAFARTSSVGDLSVRSEPDATRCADGSLTFDAGNRADAGGAVGCGLTQARRAALRDSLRHDRYGADIGALGDALNAAGVTTAAVGPGASLLLADAAGAVGLVTSDLRTAVRHARVVVVVDAALYLAPEGQRAVVARLLDVRLAAQLAAIPPGATTIVAGTSDAPTGGPHLHVVLINGPGWRHAELSSPTTRSRFVQLIDLAPTVLAALNLRPPASMIGRAVFDTARPARSASVYVDADRHDSAARRLDGSIRTAFGIAGLAALGLVVMAWRRRSRGWHGAAVVLSRCALGLPLATYLLQVVPWWRFDLGWYPVMLAGVMLVFALLTTAARRLGAAAAVVAVPALIVVVLVVDELLGAPLQRSAPLGNLALVAGRFHGMGNIAFACLGAATFLCAGVAGGQLRNRGQRGLALAAALAICLVATVVDAAPRWGDDFGGVLTMLPCTALLVALLAELRVTAKRVALTAVAVVLIAIGLSAADYARPASQRTQIGTFAGEVLHGGAGRTVWRKLYSDLHSFGNVAVTGSVVAIVVVAIVCRAQVGAALSRVAGLREAVICVALLAALGTADNDSGVVVAEFALVLCLLAVVGAGVAEPVSAVPSGRPPLPAPAGRASPAQRGEPLPS